MYHPPFIYRPCIFFSPPISLLPSVLPFKKKAGTNRKKCFLSENMQAYVEMESSKLTKQDRNDTTILSYHPYILCHFANYAHYKTLYMHISLFYT